MPSDALPDMLPILLLAPPGQDELAQAGVPKPTGNLFTRIIRDPTRPDRPMRETRCTEMLCAVLLNCPQQRAIIFKWMARAVNIPEDVIDELDWRLETERPIGSKRDDLRIEGWQSTIDGDDSLEVLWTVEVKVQANFHQSSDETGCYGDEVGDPAAVNSDVQMISQLLNYDDWLDTREAKHKAGFVLAIPNHQPDLPAGLKCRWACLTWTGLGVAVMDSLLADLLPAEEKPLARHMLGFIREHLWRSSEMANTRLNLDHIVLIRAYAAIGRECQMVADDLVAPLADIVRGSDLGITKTTHQKSLFSTSLFSVITAGFLDQDRYNVYLSAGVVREFLSVAVEWAPKHPSRPEIESAINAILPILNGDKRTWQYCEDEKAWPGIHTRVPLTALLTEDDQPAAIRQFVVKALANLKTAHIDQVVRETCEGGQTPDIRP